MNESAYGKMTELMTESAKEEMSAKHREIELVKLLNKPFKYLADLWQKLTGKKVPAYAQRDVPRFAKDIVGIMQGERQQEATFLKGTRVQLAKHLQRHQPRIKSHKGTVLDPKSSPSIGGGTVKVKWDGGGADRVMYMKPHELVIVKQD